MLRDTVSSVFERQKTAGSVVGDRLHRRNEVHGEDELVHVEGVVRCVEAQVPYWARKGSERPSC